MSSTNARRWIGVIAAATLGIGDLIVLDVIAAPAWVRSRESSNLTASTAPTPPSTTQQRAAPEPPRPLASVASAPANTATPASATAVAATPESASASAATSPTAAPAAATAQATAVSAPANAPASIDPPHFSVGSAEIGDKARSSLITAAGQMKSDLRLLVLLRGHSDSAGEEGYNEYLSLQRARAAQEFLVAMGVARDRITVVGLGAREPVDPADTPEARARNRRVEIVWKP